MSSGKHFGATLGTSVSRVFSGAPIVGFVVLQMPPDMATWLAGYLSAVNLGDERVEALVTALSYEGAYSGVDT